MACFPVTSRSRAQLIAAALTTMVCVAAWSPAHPPPTEVRTANPVGATPVAVFGTDARTKVPEALNSLRRSIGLLYNNDARTVCSAFCVSATVIATAAHCLFRTAGERKPALDGFRFTLKAQQAAPSAPLLGGLEGYAVHGIAAGGLDVSVAPPIDASHDWALARIAAPICRGAALQSQPAAPSDVMRAAATGRLFQVSFHHDFGNWDLAYSRPCKSDAQLDPATQQAIRRDFTKPDDLVLHACDTGDASSGSPLLVLEAGMPRVVAINVGTYVQTRLMLREGRVVHRFKADAVANTAVAGRVFAGLVEPLAAADIIAQASDIRRLQSALRTLGYYQGPLDGDYGPLTRAAVMAFEVAIRRAPSGIASTALLRDAIGAETRAAAANVTLGASRPSSVRSNVDLPR